MTLPHDMNQAIIPVWDLQDRMRKALRVADLSAGEMAEYLGVTRQAVSGWLNASATPRSAMLRLWAIRTGVDYGWLLNGGQTPAPPAATGPRTNRRAGSRTPRGFARSRA